MHDQNEVVAILRELLKWNVVTSYGHVKETLTNVLAKPAERLVYHLSDGTRSGLNISEQSGVNNGIISVLQSKWTKMGLMRKGAKAYERQFDLADFDIEVPDAETHKTAKTNKKKGQT
jgi:hypothetical protein